MRSHRWSLVALLVAAFAAFALPAVASAARPSPLLHKSEAALQGHRAGYQGANELGSFHIAFGDCVRQGRSKFVCPNSHWRIHDGIQEFCHQRVTVTKYRSQGSVVTHTSWKVWCGLADPKVPEPQPQPTPAPQPKPKPHYPGYDGGEDYTPNG